jgi:AraC-like DNA-binding protein
LTSLTLIIAIPIAIALIMVLVFFYLAPFRRSENLKEGINASHINLIRRYIEENYQNSGFKVKDLAAQLNLSPDYVERIYEKRIGESIKDTLKKMRSGQ